MFERFNPNLITVVAFAQDEALKLGHGEVAPEHLLLGVVRLIDDGTADLLRNRGLTFANIIRIIEPAASRGAGAKQALPISERAKNTFALAYEESQTLNKTECATEHLILALLKEQIVRDIFSKLNSSVEEVEMEVRRLGSGLAANLDDTHTLDTLRKKISTWQNRAEMAREQGQDDLVAAALEQKNKYEKMLADSN
jgi:ATP-dependent Clp protease ATP-binding subunit ClpA